MASFVKDLPEASNQITVQQPVVDRSSETLLKGLGGIGLQVMSTAIKADEANTKAEQERLKQEKLSQFELEVQDFDQSAVGKDFNKQVKTASARASQTGRSSNFTAHVESLTNQAIARDPVNADIYRKKRDDILGFNPFKKRFEAEQAEIDAKRKFQTELMQEEIETAVKSGVAVYNADNTIDMDASIANVRKFRSREAQLAKIKQSNELDAGTKQNALNRFAFDTLEDATSSALTALTASSSNLNSLEEKEAFNELATSVNALESQVRSNIKRSALQQGYTSAELAEVDTYVDAYFEPVKQIFVGPLSQVESSKRSIDLIRTHYGVNLRKSMDIYNKLEGVLGQQGISNVLSSAVTLGEGADLRRTLIDQFNNMMNDGENVGNLEHFVDVLSLGTPITQGSPEQAKQALKLTKETFKDVNRRSNELSKVDVANYLAGTNAFAQASYNSREDLQSATNTFDSAWRSGFRNIVNSGQASLAEQEIIADTARTTSLRYLTNVSTDVRADAEAAGFSLVFDTTSGRVKAVASGKGGVAEQSKQFIEENAPAGIGGVTNTSVRAITTAAQATIDFLSPNRSVMDRKVREINNALDTIVATKDYDRGLKSMSELQVMELISRNLGVGLEGTTTLPEGAKLSLEKSIVEQKQQITRDNLTKIKEIRRELQRGLEDVTRQSLQMSLDRLR